MTKLIGVVVSLLIGLAGAASARQPSAEPRRDVLILRASGPQEGVLQGCSGASCSFSGRPHSRPGILMLGLAVTASDTPPAIVDPLQDAVYLRNAVVLKSKLVSIDASRVVTAQGSHPRADVAWAGRQFEIERRTGRRIWERLVHHQLFADAATGSKLTARRARAK